VKNIPALLCLLFLLLLLTAAAPDNYYSCAERLLAGLNTVALQASVLPIVTGALDEARKNPRSNYYQNIIIMADARENRSWRAYENSRRQTRVYAAKQLAEQTLSQVSAGEQKYFYDEISGAKYRREDQRKKRELFFNDYAARSGRGADGYLENILIPAAPYLEQLFAIEVPELPDPGGADFQLPRLNIDPLGQQTARPEPKDFQWKLRPEAVYGVKHKINENVITPEQDFGLGLKIISPAGLPVRTREELGQMTPFVAIVPLPENSERRVDFRQTALKDKTGTALDFAEEPEQSAPGRPVVVNYTIPPEIQVVEFTVSDARGRPLYVKKESAPDPRDPLPFVWTPDQRGGEYYAGLKGYTAQNKVLKTAPRPLRLTERRALNYQPVVNRQSGDYYGLVDLRAWPARQGLHKIYFWLYGTEDSSGQPVAGSIYVTFSALAPENSSLSAPAETGRGQAQRVCARLLDRNGLPVAGARVEFFSLRNRQKTLDRFSPAAALTDAQGEAAVQFVSDIPGEAEIYALSDQVWVNERPLTIQVQD
jgi:hypothetical protein